MKGAAVSPIAKNFILTCVFWAAIGAQSEGQELVWEDRSPGIAATWNGAALGINQITGNQDFMVVGTNTAFAEVATSPDGGTWTRRPTGIGGIFQDVVFDGARYVAVGTNSVLGVIGTSPDGVTWTSRTSGVGGDLRGVVDSTHRGLVAVGGNGLLGKVVCSTDGGATWVEEPIAGIAPLNSVESWLSTTVAVGVSGTMIESLNGIDFTQLPSLTANDLLDVTLHRDPQNRGWVWVAVGTNGAILVDNQLPGFETNGWTVLPSVTADHLHSVTSYGDLMVACGSDGRVVTSVDGINWTVSPATSITANHLHAIAAGVSSAGGRFVSAGTNGAIFSADASGSVGGGGPGNLDVVYTGPRSIAAQGQVGLAFQVEASGGDVYTEIFASPWIHLLGADPQTIADGATDAFGFEVSPQFYEASRTGGIWVRGGNVTRTIAITQSGGKPPQPSFDGQVNTGGGLTDGEVPLRWRDPFRGTVRGYRIDEEQPIGSGNWVNLVVLSAIDRSFLHGSLQPWTRHHYRLYASNLNGLSEPSEVFVQTVPVGPPDLSATPDGWSRMRVTWSDVPGGREYILSRQVGAATEWQDVGNLAPGVGFYLDAGLPADTEVRYRMQLRSEVPQNVPPIQGVPSLSEAVTVTARTAVYSGQIFWGDAIEENLAPPVQANLMAVDFGGGKYIAVGQGGKILGSPDGSQWTPEMEPDAAGGDYSDVAYGGGVWVVVGGPDGRILRSTGNGLWTVQTLPGVRSMFRVLFQGGRFLAMAQLPGPFVNGGFPGRLYESLDGVTWNAGRDLPLSRLFAGNGQFLVPTASGAEVSVDGVSWSAPSGTPRSLYAFGGAGSGVWLGADVAGASTSVDGINWTDGAISIAPLWLTWVRGGGSAFVGGVFGSLALSADGLSWSPPIEPLVGVFWADAAFGAQGWVAVGTGGAIVRSGDGLSWTVERAYLPGGAGNTFFVDDVAVGGGGDVVAVSRGGGVWHRDPVSEVWSSIAIPNTPTLEPQWISFAGGQFIVTGSVPEDYLSSADGLSWTRMTWPAGASNLVAFASGGGKIVGVGPSFDDPRLVESLDGGLTWTLRSGDGNDVVFADGEFFTAGVDGNALGGIAAGLVDGVMTLVRVRPTLGAQQPGRTEVSVDGVSWQSNPFEADDVVYGDGVFIAKDWVSGAISASLDGVNWEPTPAGLLSSKTQLSIAAGTGSEILVASADAVVKRFVASAQPIVRGDADGVSDLVEDGAPNAGDGNADGILDRLQGYVTSLPSGDGSGSYLTVASPVGTLLANVRLVQNPSPGDAPAGMSFPFGILAFEVRGMSPGAVATVDVHLPAGVVVTDYFKFGPEPGRPADHWYDFSWDGSTGATFSPGMVQLTFVDGGRGDDDMVADGRIVDDGGPAAPVVLTPVEWDHAPPSMTVSARSGGGMQIEFEVETDAGSRYYLEASDDLVDFEILQQVIAVGSETNLLELIEPGGPRRRFYRVRELP